MLGRWGEQASHAEASDNSAVGEKRRWPAPQGDTSPTIVSRPRRASASAAKPAAAGSEELALPGCNRQQYSAAGNALALRPLRRHMQAVRDGRRVRPRNSAPPLAKASAIGLPPTRDFGGIGQGKFSSASIATSLLCGSSLGPDCKAAGGFVSELRRSKSTPVMKLRDSPPIRARGGIRQLH
jgi:hypothetical protein